MTSTSPPYMPQNNACTCNLVAYNLQAACGWCQSTIETNWWLDEAQWAGNCTTSTFDATGTPSSVSTSSINIPSWALLTNTGATWDPSVASAAAVIVSGVNTNVGTGTAAPTVTGGNTGDNNGFTFSYNPYTDTGNNNPYYFNAYYSTGVAGYAVALGTSYTKRMALITDSYLRHHIWLVRTPRYNHRSRLLDASEETQSVVRPHGPILSPIRSGRISRQLRIRRSWSTISTSYLSNTQPV